MNFALSVQIVLLLSVVFPTNLASVHALVGDESLSVVLEPVGLKICERVQAERFAGLSYVAEDDLGERSTCSFWSAHIRILKFKILYLPRPESWTISFTTPRMYPLRSACAN